MTPTGTSIACPQGKAALRIALAASLAVCAARPGHAQVTAPSQPSAPTAAAAPEAAPPGLWISGIHLSAQIEGGIMGNPAGPADGLNFGHLFTDHANQLQLNQVLLTANKPLDPKNADFQWGFKLQFMYGSDARFTQYLG
ncbi:MAG: outer membrane beta-barrel protein, partial [Nevskiales bacterium]